MTLKKNLLLLLPVLLGVLSFLESVAIFMDYSSIGFPDGHLTELDSFKTKFYPIAIATFAFLSAGYVLLGLKNQKYLKWKPLAYISFFFANILFFLVLSWASQNFNHGQGG